MLELLVPSQRSYEQPRLVGHPVNNNDAPEQEFSQQIVNHLSLHLPNPRPLLYLLKIHHLIRAPKPPQRIFPIPLHPPLRMMFNIFVTFHFFTSILIPLESSRATGMKTSLVSSTSYIVVSCSSKYPRSSSNLTSSLP